MPARMRRNPRVVARPVADHVWGLYDLDAGRYRFVDEVSARLLDVAGSFASAAELVRASEALFAGRPTRIPLDFEGRVRELVEFRALQEDVPEPATDVLLIEPPYAGGGGVGSVSPKGLCYLSHALEANGLGPAKILDLRSTGHAFRGGRAELVAYVTRQVGGCAPAVVGVSAISATIDDALAMARLAKTLFPDVFLVLGGPHPSYEWLDLLQGHRYVDAVVRGEGELPFPRIVERVLERPGDRHDFSDVPGVAWRGDDGAPSTSGWSVGVEDLDGLGWPDVYAHVLNRDDYEDLASPHFITSRGCPFRCSFCATSTFLHRKIRYRSVESVLEEIGYYWDRYGFTDFAFDDDIFTLHRRRTLALCRALEEAPFGGRVKWGCSTRLDCVDEEVVEALHRAGCTKLFFGVETGDPDVHTRLGKGRHVLEGFREKIRSLYDRGMEPRLNFILGLPGEDARSLGRIVELIRDFPGIPCSFSFLTIFPGTPLAERLDELGIVIEGDATQERYSLTAPTISTPTLSAGDQVQAYLDLQWARSRHRAEAGERRAAAGPAGSAVAAGG